MSESRLASLRSSARAGKEKSHGFEAALRALVLTANDFEDMELFFPYFRLLEEEVEVDIAAPETGVIHGEYGYGLETTNAIAEADAHDYDLLFVPGGI